MSKKLSILYILEILQKQTDEFHPLSSEQLINEVYLASKETIQMERKAVYRDIQALIDYGYDILQTRQKNVRGYYYANQRFEVAEVRLLMDAIEASTSISEKKTKQLLHKLATLVNQHEQEHLQWNINYATTKTDNEHILYHVDIINQAIQKQMAITFQYYDYDLTYKRIERKKHYQGIPYTLIWEDDKYYCVLYHEKYQQFSNYRLDKMDHIQLTETKHERIPFDSQAYLKNSMSMYRGKKEFVQLRCQKNQSLISHLFERFGKDLMVQKINDTHFTIGLSIEISPVFYGWIFQWSPLINIISPKAIQEEYENRCKQALAKMK